MKLTWISKIQVELIFVTLISAPLIKWCINFCDLSFRYFGPKFLIQNLTFLTPTEGEYFIRVEIRQYHWNCKEPSQWPDFYPYSCSPFGGFRERSKNKVSIKLCCLKNLWFIVNIVLISFILKCYPPFCVNFL